MTAVVDEYNPHGVGRYNPLLLDQLERQQAAAKRPIVMRGCTATASRDTVTVTAGLVYASGRYIAATEPATFDLSIRQGKYRVDTIVLTEHGSGPAVEMVMGDRDCPIRPKLPDNQQALAWVMVRARPVIYTDRADLETALSRILQAEHEQLTRERQRIRQRRRDCPHEYFIDASTFEDQIEQQQQVACGDCDYTETRPLRRTRTQHSIDESKRLLKLSQRDLARRIASSHGLRLYQED